MSKQSHKVNSRADLKKRFYAFLADVFFIVVLNEVLLLSYASFLSKFMLHFDKLIEVKFSSNFHAVNILSLITVFWSYFTLNYYVSNGVTPGKFFANLKVSSPKNEFLSFYECASRSTSYLICYLFGGLLLAIPFVNSQNKGIPDWLSQTSVEDTIEFKVIEIEMEEDQSEQLPPMKPEDLSLFKENKKEELPPPLPPLEKLVS